MGGLCCPEPVTCWDSSGVTLGLPYLSVAHGRPLNLEWTSAVAMYRYVLGGWMGGGGLPNAMLALALADTCLSHLTGPDVVYESAPALANDASRSARARSLFRAACNVRAVSLSSGLTRVDHIGGPPTGFGRWAVLVPA